ncbi:MAG: hypothetical protein ABH869_02120, partial [Candidatus Omnitrophota bacterium]
IVPCTEIIPGAEWQDVYSEEPITVTPVDAVTFIGNSGAAFYLWQYERAIGTEDGITKNYSDIYDQFEDLNVDVARVLLVIGSKDTSGINYDENGMPIGFKDFDKAVEDLVNLIEIAEKTDTKLTLVLHNHDIVDTHKDVLEDPLKTVALIKLDRLLLEAVKAQVGTDWQYVQDIEIMNEPDNAAVHTYYAQEFVKAGHRMIREHIGKPISLGIGNVVNIGNWLSSDMLQSGDTFQLHFYNNDLYTLLLDLKNNIGRFNIPEGVRFVYGEVQANMGNNSIITDVFPATKESGVQGVYFWFDNRENPQYTFNPVDFQQSAKKMVEDEKIVSEESETPETIDQPSKKSKDGGGGCFLSTINFMSSDTPLARSLVQGIDTVFRIWIPAIAKNITAYFLRALTLIDAFFTKTAEPAMFPPTEFVSEWMYPEEVQPGEEEWFVRPAGQWGEVLTKIQLDTGVGALIAQPNIKAFIDTINDKSKEKAFFDYFKFTAMRVVKIGDDWYIRPNNDPDAETILLSTFDTAFGEIAAQPNFQDAITVADTFEKIQVLYNVVFFVASRMKEVDGEWYVRSTDDPTAPMLTVEKFDTAFGLLSLQANFKSALDAVSTVSEEEELYNRIYFVAERIYEESAGVWYVRATDKESVDDLTLAEFDEAFGRLMAQPKISQALIDANTPEKVTALYNGIYFAAAKMYEKDGAWYVRALDDPTAGDLTLAKFDEAFGLLIKQTNIKAALDAADTSAKVQVLYSGVYFTASRIYQDTSGIWRVKATEDELAADLTLEDFNTAFGFLMTDENVAAAMDLVDTELKAVVLSQCMYFTALNVYKDGDTIRVGAQDEESPREDATISEFGEGLLALMTDENVAAAMDLVDTELKAVVLSQCMYFTALNVYKDGDVIRVGLKDEKSPREDSTISEFGEGLIALMTDENVAAAIEAADTEIAVKVLGNYFYIAVTYLRKDNEGNYCLGVGRKEGEKDLTVSEFGLGLKEIMAYTPNLKAALEAADTQEKVNICFTELYYAIARIRQGKEDEGEDSDKLYVEQGAITEDKTIEKADEILNELKKHLKDKPELETYFFDGKNIEYAGLLDWLSMYARKVDGKWVIDRDGINSDEEPIIPLEDWVENLYGLYNLDEFQLIKDDANVRQILGIQDPKGILLGWSLMSVVDENGKVWFDLDASGDQEAATIFIAIEFLANLTPAQYILLAGQEGVELPESIKNYQPDTNLEGFISGTQKISAKEFLDNMFRLVTNETFLSIAKIPTTKEIEVVDEETGETVIKTVPYTPVDMLMNKEQADKLYYLSAYAHELESQMKMPLEQIMIEIEKDIPELDKYSKKYWNRDLDTANNKDFFLLLYLTKRQKIEKLDSLIYEVPGEIIKIGGEYFYSSAHMEATKREKADKALIIAMTNRGVAQERAEFADILIRYLNLRKSILAIKQARGIEHKKAELKDGEEFVEVKTAEDADEQMLTTMTYLYEQKLKVKAADAKIKGGRFGNGRLSFEFLYRLWGPSTEWFDDPRTVEDEDQVKRIKLTEESVKDSTRAQYQQIDPSIKRFRLLGKKKSGMYTSSVSESYKLTRPQTEGTFIVTETGELMSNLVAEQQELELQIAMALGRPGTRVVIGEAMTVESVLETFSVHPANTISDEEPVTWTGSKIKKAFTKKEKAVPEEELQQFATYADLEIAKAKAEVKVAWDSIPGLVPWNIGGQAFLDEGRHEEEWSIFGGISWRNIGKNKREAAKIRLKIAKENYQKTLRRIEYRRQTAISEYFRAYNEVIRAEQRKQACENTLSLVEERFVQYGPSMGNLAELKECKLELEKAVNYLIAAETDLARVILELRGWGVDEKSLTIESLDSLINKFLAMLFGANADKGLDELRNLNLIELIKIAMQEKLKVESLDIAESDQRGEELTKRHLELNLRISALLHDYKDFKETGEQKSWTPSVSFAWTLWDFAKKHKKQAAKFDEVYSGTNYSLAQNLVLAEVGAAYDILLNAINKLEAAKKTKPLDVQARDRFDSKELSYLYRDKEVKWDETRVSWAEYEVYTALIGLFEGLGLDILPRSELESDQQEFDQKIAVLRTTSFGDEDTRNLKIDNAEVWGKEYQLEKGVIGEKGWFKKEPVFGYLIMTNDGTEIKVTNDKEGYGYFILNDRAYKLVYDTVANFYIIFDEGRVVYDGKEKRFNYIDEQAGRAFISQDGKIRLGGLMQSVVPSDLARIETLRLEALTDSKKKQSRWWIGGEWKIGAEYGERRTIGAKSYKQAFDTITEMLTLKLLPGPLNRAATLTEIGVLATEGTIGWPVAVVGVFSTLYNWVRGVKLTKAEVEELKKLSMYKKMEWLNLMQLELGRIKVVKKELEQAREHQIKAGQTRDKAILNVKKIKEQVDKGLISRRDLEQAEIELIKREKEYANAALRLKRIQLKFDLTILAQGHLTNLQKYGTTGMSQEEIAVKVNEVKQSWLDQWMLTRKQAIGPDYTVGLDIARIEKTGREFGLSQGEYPTVVELGFNAAQQMIAYASRNEYEGLFEEARINAEERLNSALAAYQLVKTVQQIYYEILVKYDNMEDRVAKLAEHVQISERDHYVVAQVLDNIDDEVKKAEIAFIEALADVENISAETGSLVSGYTKDGILDLTSLGEIIPRLPEEVFLDSDKEIESLRDAIVTNLKRAGAGEGIIALVLAGEKNDFTRKFELLGGLRLEVKTGSSLMKKLYQIQDGVLKEKLKGRERKIKDEMVQLYKKLGNAYSALVLARRLLQETGAELRMAEYMHETGLMGSDAYKKYAEKHRQRMTVFGQKARDYLTAESRVKMALRKLGIEIPKEAPVGPKKQLSPKDKQKQEALKAITQALMGAGFTAEPDELEILHDFYQRSRYNKDLPGVRSELTEYIERIRIKTDEVENLIIPRYDFDNGMVYYYDVNRDIETFFSRDITEFSNQGSLYIQPDGVLRPVDTGDYQALVLRTSSLYKKYPNKVTRKALIEALIKLLDDKDLDPALKQNIEGAVRNLQEALGFASSGRIRGPDMLSMLNKVFAESDKAFKSGGIKEAEQVQVDLQIKTVLDNLQSVIQSVISPEVLSQETWEVDSIDIQPNRKYGMPIYARNNKHIADIVYEDNARKL